MRFHRFSFVYAAAFLLIVLSGCSTEHSDPNASASPPSSTHSSVSTAPQPVVHEQPAVDQIANLVTSMSLSEKIGQMVLVGMDGTEVQPEITSLIKERQIGGIILYSNNIVSASQTNKLVNGLKQINYDAGGKLPLLLSADQEGGSVSRLPKEITSFPAS
jgi:beta-N-acetylhexosaminidase